MVKNKIISCTIPIEDYKMIEKFVEEGKYRSVSDFVDWAVKRMLEYEFGLPGMDEEALKIIAKALGIKT